MHTHTHVHAHTRARVRTHTHTHTHLLLYLFLDWFKKYFVPEARAHCISVGLDPKCKSVLLLDSCSAHPYAELLVIDNMQGMDFSPNSTSLIQPYY